MNEKSVHIAIVEDNPDLRAELHFQLSNEKNHVVVMSDGKSLDNHILHHPCDIVILDIGLPGEDGLSIANRLHQTHSDIGIIILTARSTLDSRLDGLEHGADIYLVKPVSHHELQAQIKALYRRIKRDVARWQLKQAGRELVTPQGESIPLTHMEGSIMNLLAQHSGEAVARAVLIKGIVAVDTHEFDPRRIEVCISRLRQKMQKSTRSNSSGSNNFEQPLKTVRSVGYIFTQAIAIED